MTTAPKRIGRGVLFGTLPGAALFLFNLFFVSGEAQLSVGMLAIFAALLGGTIGAVIGARSELQGGQALTGAIVGGLPGLILGRAVFAEFTLLAAAVGAAIGWLIGHRIEHRLPPPRTH